MIDGEIPFVEPVIFHTIAKMTRVIWTEEL